MIQIENMVLLNNVPPGCCPVCAVEHEAEEPHDCQSLFYQYKFYAEHKRWPTWEDAMAHCSDEMKELWREELRKFGVVIEKTTVGCGDPSSGK